MKVRGIDELIVILEERADNIGLDIDSIETYVKICAIITGIDFGEIPTFDEKRWTIEELRKLYQRVGLDFEQAMQKIIYEAWGV